MREYIGIDTRNQQRGTLLSRLKSRVSATPAPRGFHEAWGELCAATRALLWNYSPETIFLAGLMIGIVAGLLLAVVTFE